jgi:hypothetical protein
MCCIAPCPMCSAHLSPQHTTQLPQSLMLHSAAVTPHPSPHTGFNLRQGPSAGDFPQYSPDIAALMARSATIRCKSSSRLAELTSLTRLDLDGCAVPDDLAALSALTGLQHLAVSVMTHDPAGRHVGTCGDTWWWYRVQHKHSSKARGCGDTRCSRQACRACRCVGSACGGCNQGVQLKLRKT